MSSNAVESGHGVAASAADPLLVPTAAVAPDPLASPVAKRQLSVSRVLGTRKGSVRSSVYNLFSSVLGAGVLGLPHAAAQFGVVGGVCLVVPFAAASLYTLRLLLWASDLSGARSYRQLCEVTFGRTRPWAMGFVSAAIACNTFGALVVYLIVLGDIVPDLVPVATAHMPRKGGVAHLLMDPTAVIVVTGVLVALPLSLVRNLSRLRFTSFLSVASILYLTALLSARCVQAIAEDGGAQAATVVRNQPKRPWSVLLGGLPTFIYAFSCHFNFFSAVSALKKPTRRAVLTVQLGAIGLSLFVYTLVITTVLLQYADRTNPDFLVNLPSDDAWFLAGRGAYALVLVAAYPLNCHPCRTAVLDLAGLSDASEAVRLPATAGVVGLSVALAVFCPDISVALSLVGGTATASILYAFPAMFFLDLTAPGRELAIVRSSSPGVGDMMPDPDAKRDLTHVPAHRAACRALLGLAAFAWTCSLVGLCNPAVTS